MSFHTWRPPVELPQVARNSCMSCVGAQLLYMFGVTTQPEIEFVDRFVDRHPDLPASEQKVNIMLLSHGLAIRVVNAFDLEQLFREGIPYMRRYFGPFWTTEWEAYYNEDWLEEKQQTMLLIRQNYGHLLEREVIEYRLPSLDDLIRMVTDDIPTMVAMVDHVLLSYTQRLHTAMETMPYRYTIRQRSKRYDASLLLPSRSGGNLRKVSLATTASDIRANPSN